RLEQLRGLFEQEVGSTDQLVHRVQVAARADDVLERLGRLAHARDDLVGRIVRSMSDLGHGAPLPVSRFAEPCAGGATPPGGARGDGRAQAAVCGPRTSPPGRAPVPSPSRSTTWPATIVAT